MANKNHHRYSIRKCKNTKEKNTDTAVITEPKLISTWEELNGLETDRLHIVVDIDRCCGWLRPKSKEISDIEYYDNNVYLSTHTFYGSQYAQSTKLLQKLGFNVQLSNWDEETD